jgi:phosphoribosylformylglycinamidine synthase
LQFHCEQVFLKTANHNTPFTSKIPADKIIKIPIAHGEGCYFADQTTLDSLVEKKQILWQYCSVNGELTEGANPNGSLLNIAGICNENRNVAGLMPHPDRASEAILGSTDGRLVFESMVAALQGKLAAQAA